MLKKTAGVFPKSFAMWFAAILVLIYCVDFSVAYAFDNLAVITQTAEQGDASSQVLLAIAYLRGDYGLVGDSGKAAYWFEQAAIQGDAYAENRLGSLYENGLGVQANSKLAFDWQLKAAKRGLADAQLKVGKMYRDGKGVGQNANQALYWLQRASRAGNEEARDSLESMERLAANADTAFAASWFEQLHRDGHDFVILLANFVQRLGNQFDELIHKRPPVLQDVASDGDPEAAYKLAQRYENGVGGLDKDQVAATEWYRRAALGGRRPTLDAKDKIIASSEVRPAHER